MSPPPDRTDARTDGGPPGSPRPLSTDAIVGGSDAPYQSIQAAYDDTCDGNGNGVAIHVGRDYDPSADRYPIEFTPRDGTWHPVRVTGRGAGVTRIGGRGVETDVLRVHGDQRNDYGEPFVLRDCTLVAAENSDGVLLRIGALPGGRVSNVVTEGGGYAFAHVAPYLESGRGGSFNWTYRDCEIRRPGVGVWLDADAEAHNTIIDGCQITAAGREGVHCVSAAAVTVANAAVQLCRGPGLVLRDAHKFTLTSSYVEGNGRSDTDCPVELRGERVDALTVSDTYFHGINPRDTTHSFEYVQRAIDVHDSTGVTVRDNYASCYPDAFVHPTDSDVHVDRNTLAGNDVRLTQPSRKSSITTTATEPVDAESTDDDGGGGWLS